MTGMELLEMQNQGGCILTVKTKAFMTASGDQEIRRRAEALGCHFFSKPLRLPLRMECLKECKPRFDLSEPLASELYLPEKKNYRYVAP